MSWMSHSVLVLTACLSVVSMAQTGRVEGMAPRNPFLADSPWPMSHRGSAQQASTPFAGPAPGDQIEVSFVKSPGTSCWMLFSEKYSNGKRAILGTTLTHVYKSIDNGTDVTTTDSVMIDSDGNDQSWNHVLLAGNQLIVHDVDESNRSLLLKVVDARPGDITSQLQVVDTFYFPSEVSGTVQLLNVTYDGWIAFKMSGPVIGVVKSDFSQVKHITFPQASGEISSHNQFAIDPDNSMYIVTTHKMVRIDWDGQDLSVGWTSPYDFIGDGPTTFAAKGSGTTPTLVGFGTSDKLVVVADGHSSNNLVAFWRNEIPATWNELPGQDRRVAAVLSLPYAKNLNNGWQSIECSPCAFGYGIALAQFNGPTPKFCSYINAKGVMKAVWDTEKDTMRLAWATDSINMNSVLTYSSATNLVYGSGRRDDCTYEFYGLDWNTGEIKVRHALGKWMAYFDGGVNVSINDNNTLDYGTGGFVHMTYGSSSVTAPYHTPRSLPLTMGQGAGYRQRILPDHRALDTRAPTYDLSGRRFIGGQKKHAGLIIEQIDRIGGLAQ